MKVWKLAVLWAPLVAAACSEVETVPTQSPKAVTTPIASPEEPAQRNISTGSQNPPASAPPEYQHYTNIDVRADVGFSGQTAWGQSVVNYGGTTATAQVDLVGRNTVGNIVASNSATTQDSHVFPGDYGLTASTRMYVPASCGISAQATARGSVWDAFINSSQSMLQWGNKGGSDSKDALQPPCPTVPTPPDCKSISSRLGPLADCQSPPPAPGGGETSPPSGSPSQPPPEPPTYSPPYFQPKPWTEVCYTRYPGTDYERQECYRQENNDARISASNEPLAAFRGIGTASAFDGKESFPSVYVIVSEVVPAGAMAVVVRHKEGPYRNVILVPTAKIRPAELVRAMLFLYDHRIKNGETPRKNVTAHLRGTLSDSDVSAAERVYAATFTALLDRAKKANLGEFGSHPVLEIHMGAERK